MPLGALSVLVLCVVLATSCDRAVTSTNRIPVDGFPTAVADKATFEGDCLILRNVRMLTRYGGDPVVVPNIDELKGKVHLSFRDAKQSLEIGLLLAMDVSTPKSFHDPDAAKAFHTHFVSLTEQEYSLVEISVAGGPERIPTRDIDSILLERD